MAKPTNNLKEVNTMKKGLIGKKIGMTQIFDEKGNVIPVTVIEQDLALFLRRKQSRMTAIMLFRLVSAI